MGVQTLDVCASCHVNATCDDKPDGSGKVCNCMYGFVGNGRTFCQDKDECQIGASKICGQHTICHNTYGSYYCTCLSGYTPSNDMGVFIPNDGTHCRGECRLVLLSKTGTTYGSVATFVCDEGFFWANGDNTSFHAASLWSSEVDCGPPPAPPHSHMLWNKSSRIGTEVLYQCQSGFFWANGDNTSVCGADGLWTRTSMVCEEVDCGPPPAPPHSHMLWNKSSRIGTEVLYQCQSGFHNVGEGNVSICTAAGVWEEPLVLCNALLQNTVHAVVGLAFSFCCLRPNSNQSNGIISIPVEIQCGTPPSIPHSVMLWDKTSTVGSQVVYQCKSGYKSVMSAFSVYFISYILMTDTWCAITLTEIKPPIDHLYVFNENCVHWKAEKYEEDMEVYKVTYVGSRDYQRSFQDRRNKFLSSKAGQLELCLNLLPVTNYSISITAVSARFTAIITTNTSLPEFETAIPTLWLRRSANTLDPISLYQVFVLPVEKVMVFDCSSAGHQDLLNKSKSSSEYITAQILVKHIGSEMNFTVGDGFHYGGFYNAPLENGKNYYVILRAVTQWKTVGNSWRLIKLPEYFLS
uniref:Sushi domain containing 1 n=1 Tax=Echeneis naucrates TaxID=173247 RepID=A0A665WS76_ECHNA